MPTDKTKNILKGFGEGANVVLQDALSRGARPAGGFDISDGEAVDVAITGGTGSTQNPLNRTPIGAVVVNADADGVNASARATNNEVSVTVHGATIPNTVTVWVF